MPVITSSAAFGDVDGQITQQIDSYLRGEATTAIRRGNYTSVNRFMSARIRRAVSYAVQMTHRKYPDARARVQRRRPVPGAPHLVDSWGYTPASFKGGVSLFNTRPKAGMLVFGVSKDSTLTPRNYISKRTGVPVLMFPKRPNPPHLWAPSSGVTHLAESVVRPIPASQQRLTITEAIPYRAIRQSFREGSVRTGNRTG